MSNLIKQLSPELCNLISAGEVVERPSSVVKELVENAIDAKASMIRIELTDSGLSKITVTDNGTGINQSELETAILPHATSKIQTEEDLFAISTLGFRGEALPSIASVSKFTITSSTNSLDGYFVTYHASKKVNEGPVAMTKGTKVEVSDLFYNTPARFKHLKNEYIELSHVSSLIDKLAIANPKIAFTLVNNNKILFKTDGDNNFSLIVSKTYGKEAAKYLISFKGNNDIYAIKGYTTTNKVFRSNKNYINIIINNRIIKNNNLVYGILDAYKTLLPIGKFPITILEITCDPRLIDVNVHPSKLEIRFTDEQNLRGLITKTISKALYDISLAFNVESETIKHTLPLEKEEYISDIEPKPIVKVLKEESIDDLWNQFDEFDATKLAETPVSLDVPNSYEAYPVTTDDEKEELDEDLVEPIKEEHAKPVELDLDNTGFFESLHYIGQYHQTYLIFELGDDLYLIDQHAAMERVQYEKIMNAFTNAKFDIVELIVPLTIDLSVNDIINLSRYKEKINALGINYELFGGTTIIVRTIPSWIRLDETLEVVTLLLEEIIKGNDPSKATVLNDLAKTIACKSSIKAHMNILKEEVETLLKNLDKCKMPYTCPHGRPTLIKFTNYEVEKLFKRVI